jgi:hypothetical protein
MAQEPDSPKTGTAPVTAWGDSLLDSMRLVTDTLGDSAIAPVLAEGASQTLSADRLFDLLAKNNSPVPKELPPSLSSFFSTTRTLPVWADRAKIEEGERFFNRLGPVCVLSLLCKALPECYACWKGAEVLFSTGRLNEKRGYERALSRRIAETAQFLIDVMSPGGLAPDGRGIATTQKVRLIHAAIRYYLRKYGWDSAKYGEPINQEDLVGTLMAFSVATLDGIKMLGMDVSQKEQEAYLHVWKVVGYILGIEESLLPNDMESARALWAAIGRRQHGPDENGVEAGHELAKSLIEFAADHLPGGPNERVARYFVRYLVGDKVGTMLNIPPTPDEDAAAVLQIVRHIDGEIESVLDHSYVIGEIAEISSNWMMEELAHRWNDGKSVHFYVPPSLRGNWNVRSRWGARKVLLGPFLKMRIVLEKEEEYPDISLPGKR